MSRVAARSDAVRSVVLAVAFMMVVSIGGSGGQVFLPDGSAFGLRVVAPLQHAQHEETGEDGTDACESGSLMLGMEALGESFAPRFSPLSDEGRISPPSVTNRGSAHLPRIYRPPTL